MEILHSTILDSVKNIKEPQLFIPTADDLNELIVNIFLMQSTSLLILASIIYKVEGNNVFQKELESL